MVTDDTNEESVRQTYVFIKYSEPNGCERSSEARSNTTRFAWLSQNALDCNTSSRCSTDAVVHQSKQNKTNQHRCSSRLVRQPKISHRKVLPECVGPLSKDLYGIPLQEIEHNIMDEVR
uniref:Uncharacterized protein n=1 Tax=Octopus bimaculoides TaxID=37653 RepID=A0A0L8HLV4_OCTBM